VTHPQKTEPRRPQRPQRGKNFLRSLWSKSKITLFQRRPFRFSAVDGVLWWVLISLVAISFIGNHPYLALSIAVVGGALVGVLTTINANCRPPVSRSWVLWAEPALVLLLSPVFLFPTPKRSIFFIGLTLLLLVHFVVTRRVVEPTPALLPVILLLVMVSVSLYATYDLHQSLPKVAGMLLGAAAFIAIVDSIFTQRHVALMLAALLLGGVALACIGLLGTQWINKVSILAKTTSRLPAVIRGLQGAEEGFQPNGIAGGLILFIPLQVALAYRGIRKALARKSEWRLLVAVLTTLLITGGVVILTQSRGGWLGLAIALLVLLAWSSRKGRWFAGIVALVGIIAVVWLGPRKIGDSIMSGIGGTSGVGSSIDGRLEVWNRAIYGISDFPFTGMGMNTFRKVVHVLYPLFLTSPDTDIAHCHNQLLQAALDLGIPGLVAYVALLATALTMGVYVWRHSKEEWIRCSAQGLVCGIVAQQVFGITDAIALGAKVGIFFWVALGLLAAMHRLTKLNHKEKD
jgi:putative inorganic carbon (HCO3(-)) transporter